MKDHKKRIETFSFFDYDGISRHLEKMAANGWMIERLTNFFWVYRRIEPKKINFAVSYYPKASEFDPEPSDEQKTFHEFCAHTGWELACTSAQLQIFYNERENPTPIETEPALEVESIHASAKKSFIPSYILLLLLLLLQSGIFIHRVLDNPVDQLASPTKLFIGFCFLVSLLSCAVELFFYFRWYHRAKTAAGQGEFLKPTSTSKFHKVLQIVITTGLIYWTANIIIFDDKFQRWIYISVIFFYIPALLILVNAVKMLLKHKKASREVNRTITILTSFVLSFIMMGIITFGTLKLSSSGFFTEAANQYHGIIWGIHQDKLPLTAEDLRDVNTDDYIKEYHESESLLLGQLVMHQYPRSDAENYDDIPQLNYNIVSIKIPALYNFCKNQFIHKWENLYPTGKWTYKTQDAAPWSANEAYRLYDTEHGYQNDYLLCYDDMLVDISFDWEPTEEQMQIVSQKLNP